MQIIVKSTSNTTDKRRAWEEIKEHSPDMANFIRTITKEFGKPKKVRVTIRDNADTSKFEAMK